MELGLMGKADAACREEGQGKRAHQLRREVQPGQDSKFLFQILNPLTGVNGVALLYKIAGNFCTQRPILGQGTLVGLQIEFGGF